MRPPGNVPYVVDNLWEWKRPVEYPNRRYAAFASPTAELAKESVRGEAIAYKVEFKDEYKLCQLKGLRDSKYHPECNNLRVTLLDKIGKEWINNKINEKNEKLEIGKLFIPCLTKEEVDELFNTVVVLKKNRLEVYNAINYWDDVVLIQEGNSLPDRQGEVFFEAEDGYKLVDI